MSLPDPRVSILIPNFNNGRQSSKCGTIDFIGDLLRSLHDTLHADPTPFELLVNDDASTDDGVETLRSWAAKTWPDGRPFLALVESPHEGFIAAANNRMFARARGDIFVRLDGDIVCLTKDWVSRVAATLDGGPPDLGILAPKQLLPNGTIHAFGDMILHPKGYHHVAQGLGRHAASRPREVDHAMGCFYACRRAVHESIGGYDEGCLRGETEDFTVAARLKGWRCWAVPDVEFVHRHGLRKGRASQYDDPRRVAEDLLYFENKWGFNRLAPDLDAVAERYAGTPLVWNAEVFGPRGEAAEQAEQAAVGPQHSEWGRFATDERLRAVVDAQAQAARRAVALGGPAGETALVGCGDGVALHLLAQDGVACVGVEWQARRAAMGERFTAGQTYAGERPRFATGAADRRRLPLGDASCAAVVLWDQFGQHPNPVALLREAGRILKPGGLLTVIEPRRAGGYHDFQLRLQINSTRGWERVGEESPPPDADAPIQLTARKPREASVAMAA